MKAVLMSIRPEWCKKILRGEKTVEVRKTRPELETPFKVYIYCTRNGVWLMKLPNGLRKMQGKIIGEFVCDKIDKLFHVGVMGGGGPVRLNVETLDGRWKSAEGLIQAACLSEQDAEKYLQGRNGYGWHISDLKIYEQPCELSEFSPNCRFKDECGECEYHRVKCEHQRYNFNPDGEVNVVCCDKRVQIAPQSWCYVEEAFP